MRTRTQLLDQIDRFLAQHQLSARQFGLDAVGDHRFVARVRAGLGVTLTVIDRAESFMESRDKSAVSADAGAAAAARAGRREHGKTNRNAPSAVAAPPGGRNIAHHARATRRCQKPRRRRR